MLSVFRRIPIRIKIVFFVVLIVLLPMTFSGLYFNSIISSILTKNAYDSLNQLIHQTSDGIENSFSIIDNTSMHFLSNNLIRNWLSSGSSYERDIYRLFIKKSELESELKYSMMFNNAWETKLITTAYLFINESTYCSVSRSFQNPQSINENNINIYKRLSNNLSRGLNITPPSTNDRTIYFSRYVMDVENPKQVLHLIIGTEEGVIFQKYEKLLEFKGSRAYIIDDKGIVYSSSDKSMLGKTVDNSILEFKDYSKVKEVTLDNQTYFMAFKKIGESGLTFVVGIPKKQVLVNLADSMKKYVLITVCIVLIFLLLSISLSIWFTRIIKDLLYHINRVKAGDYQTKMPSYKDYELGILSETFNNMTGEIKYLISQVYEKQLLLKEADIKFLQSQMNPHFLFNVLVTISTKAKMSKDETIYKMVTSLGNLLQAGIYSNSKTKITIKQELEYVRFYLYLQKMRFEEKLEYEINIYDHSILDCHIPKLCVEPIVENAVVHGLEGKAGKGRVILNVKTDSECIIFEIIDDGLGFEMEKIDLNNISNRKDGHNSIGLNNTNRRIKLIYGEEYGIQIESVMSKGSKIIVRIPLDKGDDIYA